jgi:flagellar biosynthesis protein FlhG
LAADSGRASWTALAPRQLAALVDDVVEATRGADALFIDGGAGIGPAVVGLASACPRVWVVLHPEPTSLADAYATCKVLLQASPQQRIEVIVSGARSDHEAHSSFERLDQLTRRFLAKPLRLRATLPFDLLLGEAVRRQQPLVELAPGSDYARHIRLLAEDWLRERRRAGA